MEIDLKGTKYPAFIDFESGIIVMQRMINHQWRDVLVLTTFGVVDDSVGVTASSWDNAIAISYPANDTTYTIFVTDERVYFGVSFKDETGADIEANECWNAKYVFVTDKDGKQIASYGFSEKAEKLVVLDEFYGTYTGEKTLVVNGFGGLLFDGKEGTYEIAEEGFTLGAYVENEYFEITLDTLAMTYTYVKPLVTITFDSGEYAEVEDASVNKNIEYKLPNPENDEYAFKGWFYDEDCQEPVEEPFVPTEDVTLYALWKVKVVIKLHGVKDGDKDVLVLGEGDVIGEYLPKYGIDLDAFEVFRGWYLDADFEQILSESIEVTPEDNNVDIYAKWEKLPAYYGTRYGVELWSVSNGNGDSHKAYISIDENGNITGKWTGKVTKYENGVITWNDSSNRERKFYFDEESGILMTHYSTDLDIGTDFYVFSKYQTETSFKVKEFVGIGCVINPTTGDKVPANNYYLHFIVLNTEDGDLTIVRYGNNIYSAVKMTDTSGNELDTIAEIKASKTVVITNTKTNEKIIAFGTAKASLSNGDAVVLDDVYGTYTKDNDTIVLDGMGNITYQSKSGTYTKSSNDEYDFDVYLEDETEYYRLTLTGDHSFEMELYMVTVTFENGEHHDPMDPQEYNANVSHTLPNVDQIGKLDDKGYIFNGWFFDQAYQQPVPNEYTPTADITIYAKYSLPARLTIVYNNGEENGEEIYSVGDKAVLKEEDLIPTFAKHIFVGWYTTNDYQEGTEWESGTVINTDTTIYAKWENGPVYNNDYDGATSFGLKNDAVTGESNTSYSANSKLNIDPYGVAPHTSYPFNGSADVKMYVKDYDPKTGKFVLEVSSSTKLQGYIDAETGIMILDKSVSGKPAWSEIWFLTPLEKGDVTSKIVASYWNSNKAIAIQYKYNDTTTYSIFVYNGVVYFGASFKDATGKDIPANECYNVKDSKLVVTDSEGKTIAEFGYDGKQLVELDGYWGTYHNNEDTLVLDGVKKATYLGQEGTYSLAADGSSYTIDLYINNEFFEITINKDDMSYTINKPMVKITYDTDEKAEAPAQEVNKNIPITLPTVSNPEYEFLGWYVDPQFETLVTLGEDGKYLPTESTTLYAKWAKKVTFKVVYGNEMEDVAEEYYVGYTPELVKPEMKNDLVFDGWYTDQDYKTPYVEGTPLEASTTVYCKWKEKSPLLGSYYGFNTYGTSSHNGGWWNDNITVDEYGKMAGDKKGTVEQYDPETGFFILKGTSSEKLCYFDATLGIIVVGENEDDFGTDMYVYVRTDSKPATALGSIFEKGVDRLVCFTANGTTTYIYISGKDIYINVTFKAELADGSEITEMTASKQLENANSVTIYDADGEEIATYAKGVKVEA